MVPQERLVDFLDAARFAGSASGYDLDLRVGCLIVFFVIVVGG